MRHEVVGCGYETKSIPAFSFIEEAAHVGGFFVMTSKDEHDKNFGVPEGNRIIRRTYTMTPAALAARQANAQKSTGPITEDGKKASARNAWRHGLYAESFILGTLGKPCRSTCEQYPCSLVEDGKVDPGETCLDKQFVAEAFDAINDSIKNNSHDRFRDMAALEMAGALDILRKMKESIIEDGVLFKEEKTDKDGHRVGWRYVPNPVLLYYNKMLVDLGFTPNDFLMTPREIDKVKKGDAADKLLTAATLMSNAAGITTKKTDDNDSK